MADAMDDLRPAPQAGADARPAGFLRRSAAAAIDALVLLAFLFAESFVLLAVLGFTLDRQAIGRADLAYFATGLGFAWLYCALSESGTHAATPGKRLLGLEVRDRHGLPLGFARASGRFLARTLTLATLLLGWLLILVLPRRQALHDLVAGTVVVVADRRHPGAKRPG